MLTKLTIRNFKVFEHAEIPLGNPVVFVGPNDSGKTSALQALTLWQLGLRRWIEKRADTLPGKRSGVAVNRRDLTSVPVPVSRQLWHDLNVRKPFHDDKGQRTGTQNLRIDVIVEGVSGRSNWECGLEFDYANSESFYCRPLRTSADSRKRMDVPDVAGDVKVALLGPLSGLSAHETKLEQGAINVRLGEGRTAEVLRNLCWHVTELSDGDQRWRELTDQMAELFGVRLDRPQLVHARGEVELTYSTRNGIKLDLTASGRGMQQTLLLLTFLKLHPGHVILLDEPDAHMEILRQRETYDLLSKAASDNNTQVILASHSEVVLNEAVSRIADENDDEVIAFVGAPHPIVKKSEVLKALRDIHWSDYYKAEITGFVLYVEGSTDLVILQAFAEVCEHEARNALVRPFVHYVGNHPKKARSHFYGLQEAKSDLKGVALFDNDVTIPQKPKSGPKIALNSDLVEKIWPRREIENYLLPTETLIRYAQKTGKASAMGPLFEKSAEKEWVEAMGKAIDDRVPRAALRDLGDSYWHDTKISDGLLGPVFKVVQESLGPDSFLPKRDYYRLADYLTADEVHSDVISVLDAIAECASRV